MIRKYIFRRGVVSAIPAASEFGFLYNRLAIEDSRNIASAGYRIATNSDWANLASYAGTASKLKKSGTTHWQNDNGTDDYGFGAIGGGYRDGNTGAFSNIKVWGYYWTSEGSVYSLADTGDGIPVDASADPTFGFSLRICRDAVGIEDGVTGIYTGNDGHVYQTVVINEIEWVSENIRETKYQTGASIEEITLAEQWVACSTLPEIGENYGSGIVFALDANFVYVVTPQPALTGNNFGNYGGYLHVTEDGYLGAGYVNTDNMQDEEPDTFFTELVEFGYDGLYDWYVPCVYELQLIVDRVYNLLTIPDLGSPLANRINTSVEYDYDLYWCYTSNYGFNQQYYKGDIDPSTDGHTFGVRRVISPKSSARCIYNNDPGNVLGIENLVTYNGVPVVYNGVYVTHTK